MLHLLACPYHTFVVDEQLVDLREKVKQDYSRFSINNLCVKRSERYDVMFFNLDERSSIMVSKIAEIKSSRIFNELWGKYCEVLKDEVMTIEIICEKIWLKIYNKLHSRNQDFMSGDMMISEIEIYFKMCRADYHVLQEEFKLLSGSFFGAETFENINKQLVGTVEKFRMYRKLFHAQETSKIILMLQRVMGLQGDFSVVECIDEVCICESQLTCHR